MIIVQNVKGLLNALELNNVELFVYFFLVFAPNSKQSNNVLYLNQQLLLNLMTLLNILIMLKEKNHYVYHNE